MSKKQVKTAPTMKKSTKIAVAAVLYILAAWIMRSKELNEIVTFLFKRKKQGV